MNAGRLELDIFAEDQAAGEVFALEFEEARDHALDGLTVSRRGDEAGVGPLVFAPLHEVLDDHGRATKRNERAHHGVDRWRAVEPDRAWRPTLGHQIVFGQVVPWRYWAGSLIRRMFRAASDPCRIR